MLLALAVVALVTAVGLLVGKKWSWWVAVLLFSVNGLGDLITLIAARDLARSGSGVLVASLFLYLLMRPDARRHFESLY